MEWIEMERMVRACRLDYGWYGNPNEPGEAIDDAVIEAALVVARRLHEELGPVRMKDLLVSPDPAGTIRFEWPWFIVDVAWDGTKPVCTVLHNQADTILQTLSTVSILKAS